MKKVILFCAVLLTLLSCETVDNTSKLYGKWLLTNINGKDVVSSNKSITFKTNGVVIDNLGDETVNAKFQYYKGGTLEILDKYDRIMKTYSVEFIHSKKLQLKDNKAIRYDFYRQGTDVD